MKESDFLDENANILNRLRDLPILDHFDDKDLKWMLPLCKVVEYNLGENIIKEGDKDECIYFILSGKVRVMKENIEMCTLHRLGDVFGEMALIESRSRSASVEALGKTLCLRVEAAFADALEKEDKMTFQHILYRIFTYVLATRLRDTSQKLVEATSEIEKLKKL